MTAEDAAGNAAANSAPLAELTRLRQLNAALIAYREASERLLRAGSLAEVAVVASDILSDLFGAQGALLLLAPDAERPRECAREYAGAGHLELAPPAVRAALLEVMAGARQPVAAPDAAAFLRQAGLPAAPRLRNFLALPLDEGRLGALIVCNFRFPGHLPRYAEEAQAFVAPIAHAVTRVRLVEAHAREARLLETIVENANSQIAYLDAQFNFVRVNSAYVAGCGYSRQELIGRNHFDLFPSPDNEEIFRRARDTGQPVEFREKPFVYAHQPERGVTHWNWILTPLRDAAGAVEALVLSLTDMTEHVRAREQLAAAERAQARQARLLETILASTENRFAYLDRDLRFVHVNPQFAAYAGANRDALLGRTFLEVFPRSPDLNLILERVRDTGQAAEFHEFPRLLSHRPDLGLRYFDFSVQPVMGEEAAVEGLVMSALDVTEAVQTRERMLEVERARARMAETMVQEVNHRMKNNLAIVGGLLQMQIGDRDPRDPLGVALRQAITRIACLATIHEQMSQTGAETVELHSALRRIADMARTTLAAGNAEVSLRGEPTAVASKTATTLCVAANELLTNAIKYGAPGPDGKLRIDVTLNRGDGQLHLSVWNSGNPVRADSPLPKRRSMGLRLVRDLAGSQAQGAFSLRPHQGGTLAELVIQDEPADA